MFNISQGSWVKIMFRIPFLGGIHITEAETLAKEIKFENEANGQMSLGRDSDISSQGIVCGAKRKMEGKFVIEDGYANGGYIQYI